jgi:hypothetical protein
MVTLWEVNIVVGSVSVALLSALALIYGRNLRRVKSPFAVGLLLFALLFIVENVVAIFSYFNLWSRGFGPEVALPMLYVNLAEVTAFSILAIISWG